MASSLEKLILAGFGAALALVLAIVWISYQTAQKFAESARAGSHAQTVLAELATIQSNLADAETGQRGYIITGTEPYLEPYTASVTRLDRELVRLKNLTVDDPAQRDRVEALQPLIESKLREMRDTIELRRVQGREAAHAIVMTDEGRRAMDAIRRAIQEMVGVENRVVAQRAERSEALRSATTAIMTGGAALGLIVVVVACVLILRAIRERRTMQAERDRFFDVSIDLLCIAGFDGRFKRLNQAWETTIGYTVDDLLAEPFLQFVHPDDRERTAAEAQKLATGVDTISFENRYRCKDGSYKWLAWCAKPFLEEQRIYAVARDITERKRIEQELTRRGHDLAEANKELEAFSYSVSHDLRAPLRHIHGFARILQEDAGDQLTPENRQTLTVIARAAQQMGHLIDDLLVFSRIGREEMRKVPVDLNDLITATLEELQPAVRGRQIEWKIGALPVVEGDRGMLRQVFVNLLDNAVKYTGSREHATIEVGAFSQESDRGDDTIVFVRDNGVGFDMRYAHKLFGVFQRLHRSDEFEGTGIGLANIKRVITRHGGRVWAEGAVGVGATFFFSVPMAGKGVLEWAAK